MIHFLQPYDYNLNIGKAYNYSISLLPPDSWICITDQDTLKFEGFAQRVLEIVRKSEKNYLITCKTNRLRKSNKTVVSNYFENDSVRDHLELNEQLWKENGTNLEPYNLAAGVCMIFHKSMWEKVKFEENTVVFDRLFSRDFINNGGKIFIAKGLYLFHLYRYGKKDPENNISHLINK